MSTYNISKIDKKRGDRHKSFREDVLHLGQEELVEELSERGIDKSQPTISNYDRGQKVSEDVLLFYADKGMNIHWYFTGKGPMVYELPDEHDTALVHDEPVSYKSLQGLMKYHFNSSPLAEFFHAMDKLKRIYIDAMNLKKSQRKDIEHHIVEKIREKFTLLQ